MIENSFLIYSPRSVVLGYIYGTMLWKWITYTIQSLGWHGYADSVFDVKVM